MPKFYTFRNNNPEIKSYQIHEWAPWESALLENCTSENLRALDILMDLAAAVGPKAATFLAPHYNYRVLGTFAVLSFALHTLEEGLLPRIYTNAAKAIHTSMATTTISRFKWTPAQKLEIAVEILNASSAGTLEFCARLAGWS